MAAIDDLISQIPDKTLRERIRSEVCKIGKRKKFGLVFENHLPECTLLYDHDVIRGRLVARRGEPANILYEVLGIDGDMATCIRRH